MLLGKGPFGEKYGFNPILVTLVFVSWLSHIVCRTEAYSLRKNRLAPRDLQRKETTDNDQAVDTMHKRAVEPLNTGKVENTTRRRGHNPTENFPGTMVGFERELVANQ